MPLVELYFNPERLSPERAGFLAKRLPHFVAAHLSVPGMAAAQLAPDDVEVRVRAKGPHDITAYGLEVTVWAKHYPERELLVDRAAKEISRLIALTTLGNVKGFVYILLAPAGFAEFVPGGG